MRVINKNKERSVDYLLSGYDYTSNPEYNSKYLNELLNDNNFFTMDGQITSFVKQACLKNIMLYFQGRIQSIPDPRFTEMLKYELSSSEYMFYQLLARDTVLKDTKSLFGGVWRESKQDTTSKLDTSANSSTKQDTSTDNVLDSSASTKTGAQVVGDSASNTNKAANTHRVDKSGDVVVAQRSISKVTGGVDTTVGNSQASNVNKTEVDADNNQDTKSDVELEATNRAGNVTSRYPMSALPNEGGSVDSFLLGTSGEGPNGTSSGNAMEYASGGVQNLGNTDSATTSNVNSNGTAGSITDGNSTDTKLDTVNMNYGKSEVDKADGYRDTNSEVMTEGFNTNETATGKSTRNIGSRDDVRTAGETNNTKGKYDANTDRWNKEDRESHQYSFSDGSNKPYIDLLNSLNDVTEGYKSAYEYIQGKLESLFNQVFGTWQADDDDEYSDTYPL